MLFDSFRRMTVRSVLIADSMQPSGGTGRFVGNRRDHSKPDLVADRQPRARDRPGHPPEGRRPCRGQVLRANRDHRRDERWRPRRRHERSLARSESRGPLDSPSAANASASPAATGGHWTPSGSRRALSPRARRPLRDGVRRPGWGSGGLRPSIYDPWRFL